jgi:transcriptional regulator with XRE-family HTH domain
MKQAMKDEYWKGQAVEIRLRHGTKESWIGARVDSPTRRGANVTNNSDGRQHHVFFNDLRPFPRHGVQRTTKTIGTPVLDPKWLEQKKLENSNITFDSSYKTQAEESLPKNAVVLSVVQNSAPAAAQPCEAEQPRYSTRGPMGERKTRNHHNITPFAAFIRAERLRRAKTQDQMAAILNIDPKRIGRLELAVLRPNDDVLIAISESLNIDLGKLLELRDGTSLQQQHELPMPQITQKQISESYAAVAAADKTVPVPAERSELEQLAARLGELRARADVLTAELAPIGVEIESIKNKIKEQL